MSSVYFAIAIKRVRVKDTVTLVVVVNRNTYPDVIEAVSEMVLNNTVIGTVFAFAVIITVPWLTRAFEATERTSYVNAPVAEPDNLCEIVIITYRLLPCFCTKGDSRKTAASP